MNRLVKFFASQGRNSNVLLAGVSLALIAVLAYYLAVLTWDLTAIGRKHAQPPPAAKASVSRSGSIATTGPEPALLNLFGQPNHGAVPAGPDQPLVESIPSTALGLVLKGVIGLTPRKRALALIGERDKSNGEDVYGVGDTVAGVAVLREIHDAHVILLRAGKLEILKLEEDVVKATAPPGGTPPMNTAQSGPEIISRGDGVHWQISQTYLKDKMADLPTLAKEVGLDIYKENDVQKGYRLVSTRGSKMLDDLGLKAGDILLEVNGIKLVDAHRGLLAYQKLREGSEINMAIQRNGVTKNMIYSLGKN